MSKYIHEVLVSKHIIEYKPVTTKDKKDQINKIILDLIETNPCMSDCIKQLYKNELAILVKKMKAKKQ